MISWKSVERVVAKDFQSWWHTHDKTASFRRTPMSGAFDPHRFGGDVFGPEEFPFCVECKADETWDFRLAMGIGSSFRSYTLQVFKSAYACRRHPVLVLTKKYVPYYAGFTPNVVKQLPMMRKLDAVSIRTSLYAWQFVNLQEFLQVVTPKDVIRLRPTTGLSVDSDDMMYYDMIIRKITDLNYTMKKGRPKKIAPRR